mgnify:FL=1
MSVSGITERANSWILGPDTGRSSRTIWGVMMGAEITAYFGTGLPEDPNDFGRCYRLLKLMPEWKWRLSEVVQHYPQWRLLVQNWTRLEHMYADVVEEGKNTYVSWRAMYDVMQQLRKAS